MKNKDILAMEKAKFVEKMNQAIKDDDSQAFSEAFSELCQKIEDNVLEQARDLLTEQDATVLAQRGVRQLTSKEKEYYEKVIEAMKSPNPKQALSDVDVVMPETIIDSVFDELATNHPLLSKLSATTVTGLTRMMMNTNGEQKAAWGKLTAKIIEELTSGFKEVDVTQDKLSAFLPVSKAMLDLGPAWLDNYVRQVLYEALSNGLEYGIVNGTGLDMPVGMMKQVGEGVTVTGGKYPDKKAIKMTALDMTQMGNVTAIMARNDKGQARVVTDLILLVNPVDYWRRVLPATRMLTPDGVYVSTLPVPAEIIQSAAVPEGKAVYGMAGKYFLGVGMASNGRIEYSDEYRFLEDERVYLIKLYANGFAKDNNAFMVLDITDIKPVRFEVVNVTETPVHSAVLSDLRIGGKALSPEFAGATTTYTVTTDNATNTITAVQESGTADIAITVGDKSVTNGAAATWTDGTNTVKVVVTDGDETKTYTVTVTKE
ncbi:phage major capsid protein [Hespellia stercorisuis]|uniref:Phage major capsid protein, HK97 family n=1 Tax=Hespellia stercorisuis DSM 15480 TaxID=1121950 RepID=A0A1M6MVR6_9FIRM|nr:phage major capsid protein [Hespellia stercorisuis]SHJ87588.1 phage major capsid protein, HK97 family [Hespellia stercorisuis DSM 15480]